MPQASSSRLFSRTILTASLLATFGNAALQAAEVKAQLVTSTSKAVAHKAEKPPSAAIWLKPLDSGSPPAVSAGRFTLLQKNKMFTPHLLVVPVGSSVAFPNADPFFHNVFSLFDGKRFDLGLYEAGSTRSVVFSRVGVSYIFCNIHSEMSAVVIALDTPFYSIADASGAFDIAGVPDGDYSLRVWIEGQTQSSLDQLTRRVHVAGTAVALGDIHAGTSTAPHLNKFGHPYEPDAMPTY
jgi:plastocyanin